MVVNGQPEFRQSYLISRQATDKANDLYNSILLTEFVICGRDRDRCRFRLIRVDGFIGI
jgi:hypothetical protein